MPARVIEQWKSELSRSTLPSELEGKLRKHLARYEDQGQGVCWLRKDPIAALVERALLEFDDDRYRIIAWCIMPNHVHALIETLGEWTLDRVVHGWKSYTAHEANRVLGRTGQFWAREYHDRFVRDDDHLKKAIRYIENNPVNAGLVPVAEAWPRSSAGYGR
ncbi:MAG TPA: transposase [Thermoanaerobaculia bacterium]|nr:transposase [Thermoanaerobaculia bacterium]